MNKFTSASLLLILLILNPLANAHDSSYYFNTSTPSFWPALKNEVVHDYGQYYLHNGVPYLISGLSVGLMLANTHIDNGIRHDWQLHYRNHFSNQFSKVINNYSQITQYPISLPLFFALWRLTENNLTFTAMNTWSNHCLRSLLLGAPQQAILTTALGSGRPENSLSYWQWFEHQRAVSGHAFYGAIPLLNLAEQTSNAWLKTSYYLLSTLPGLARINDDKHYSSQVFLGWWLAFSATKIVWHSAEVSKKPNPWLVQLYPANGTIYLGLHKII